MTRRVLVRKLQDNSFSDEGIKKTLQDIMVVNIAGVNAEQPNISSEPNFTTVFFDSQQDTLGKTLNPSLDKHQELLHGKGMCSEIVMRPLSGNRVQVSIPIDFDGAVVPHYNKESGQTEPLPHDPEKHSVPGHELAYYLFPNDATSPGGAETVRKVLQYAVSREGSPVDMLQYLSHIIQQHVPEEKQWTVYVRNNQSANRER